MVNLVTNLKTFLAEIKSQAESIRENDAGYMIIKLKEELIADPDKYIPFIRSINPIRQKLRLDPYIKFTMTEYHIDTVALRSDQLKDFFHKDVTKDDAIEDIDFLVRHGWTEGRFNKEIGISKPTLYRYKKGLDKTEPENMAE